MSRRAQSTVRVGMAALSVAVAAFTTGCPGLGGTGLNVGSDGTITVRRSPSPTPTRSPSPAPTATSSVDPTPTPDVSADPTPTPTPSPTPTTAPSGSGGLDVRTLDMAPNSWSPHTPMILARQGLVAVDGGDRLFVFTGDGSLTDETFTYATGQWQRYRSSFGGLGQGGTNLYFAGAAMVDSTVAVLGGMSGDEWGANYTGLALGSRDPMGMPKQPDYPSALLELAGQPVYSMGVTSLDGKVYVAGGRDLQTVRSASYVFDTLQPPDPSDPFRQVRLARSIASLRFPRAGLGLAAVDGRIFAVGGYTLASAAADRPDADTLMQVYHPATNAWLISGEPGGPARMPTERYGFAVAALNGKIYVVGGKNELGATLRTVEAYDPATDTWATLAPMPTARSILALVPHNGRLYALGGADAAGRATRVVEVYAP